MAQNPLIGSWRLLSFESRTKDGEVSYPLGPDVVGCIMYNENDTMSVAMMSGHRPNFTTQDMLRGTTIEKVAGFDTYLSYCGRYTLLPGKVVHHIEISLYPNWVGGDQERFFELDGDKLTLSTPPILISGARRTSHLIWEKMLRSK